MRHISIGLLAVFLVSSCSWIMPKPTRVENPIVEGVNYIGVTVANLDKTEKLYTDATEITVVENNSFDSEPVIDEIVGRAGVKVDTRLMRGVNSQVLLMAFEQPSEKARNSAYVDANGPGIAHLAFQVVDKTQTYEKFLDGGAKVIGTKEMMKNPKTHVSYAYVRDLDDIMVEVEHVDIEPLNLPAPPKNNRRIRHISLATTDMDRSVAFYEVLLETENPRRSGVLKRLEQDNINGFTDSEMIMAWFQVRNLELEIIQYHVPVTKPLSEPRAFDATGYNVIMFDVTSLAKVKEKLIAAGAKIVSENKYLHGSKVLLARDPDGNLLGFQSLDAQSPYSAKNFKNNGLE